jgi:hypothetical protein
MPIINTKNIKELNTKKELFIGVLLKLFIACFFIYLKFVNWYDVWKSFLKILKYDWSDKNKVGGCLFLILCRYLNIVRFPKYYYYFGIDIFSCIKYKIKIKFQNAIMHFNHIAPIGAIINYK